MMKWVGGFGCRLGRSRGDVPGRGVKRSQDGFLQLTVVLLMTLPQLSADLNIRYK
jgi:hypothetical protein